MSGVGGFFITRIIRLLALKLDESIMDLWIILAVHHYLALR